MKALKFRIVQDAKMKDKITDLKERVEPQMLPEISAIEMCKVNDALRCEFDFDLDYLFAAARHF